MTAFAIIIYMGGVSAASEVGQPLWKALLWPVSLGRWIVFEMNERDRKP